MTEHICGSCEEYFTCANDQKCSCIQNPGVKDGRPSLLYYCDTFCRDAEWAQDFIFTPAPEKKSLSRTVSVGGSDTQRGKMTAAGSLQFPMEHEKPAGDLAKNE